MSKKESLSDLIMKVVKEPDTKPYLYKVGQVGRVKSGVSRDGQTPLYWNGAKVVILTISASVMWKEHWYKVKHIGNNKIEEFREYELDKRFARK